MIRKIQKRWNESPVKQITSIALEFQIAQGTARKYVHMSEEQIQALDTLKRYKDRKTKMDDYYNIIYKMLADEIAPTAIFSYVIYKGYSGKQSTLESYIRVLARNNFNIKLPRNFVYKQRYPKDVTVIKKAELLKYITIKKTGIAKSEKVGKHIEIIKTRYPIVGQLEEIYNEFHETLMGEEPAKLDEFIKKNEESCVSGFIDGLKRDIAPIKNAISHDESNGFVEGNNNKFKLIKRILYGRANLVNLFKKCYAAFRINTEGFTLSSLL